MLAMIRVRRLFVELWWQKSYWSKFKRKQRKIGDYWHRNLFLGEHVTDRGVWSQEKVEPTLRGARINDGSWGTSLS